MEDWSFLTKSYITLYKFGKSKDLSIVVFKIPIDWTTLSVIGLKEHEKRRWLLAMRPLAFTALAKTLLTYYDTNLQGMVAIRICDFCILNLFKKHSMEQVTY